MKAHISATLILAVLTLWCATEARGQSCVQPAQGIEAWWQGEDNAVDIVNANNGSTNGTVTYAAGEAGQAFVFNGSSSILIPESPSVNLSQMTNWTIEAWINPASFNNSIYPTIFDQGHWRASLGLNSGTGELENWINNNDVIDSTASVPLGQWSHVAIVYNGVNRIFYINGVASGSFSCPAVSADTSGDAIGGVSDNSGDGYFDGEIDEVSIYNTALSASQIASIYAAGTAGKCPNEIPLTIVSGPTNQVVNVGGTAYLSVTADNVSPIYYQWLFNGSPLSNDTNATLTLSPVNITNGGAYSVVLTNSTGSVTSGVALLVVPVPGAGSNVAVYSGYYDEPPSPGEGGSDLPLPNPWYGSANTTYYGNGANPTSDLDVSTVLLLNLGSSAVVLSAANLGSDTYDLFGIDSITNYVLLPPNQFAILVGPDGSDVSFTGVINLTMNGTVYSYSDATNATYFPSGALHGYPSATDETVPWTTVYVPAAVPLVPPVITNLSLGPLTLTVATTNGLAGRTYTLLAANTLASPPQLWSVVASAVINSNNQFTITGPRPAGSVSNQFYMLQGR